MTIKRDVEIYLSYLADAITAAEGDDIVELVRKQKDLEEALRAYESSLKRIKKVQHLIQECYCQRLEQLEMAVDKLQEALTAAKREKVGMELALERTKAYIAIRREYYV